MSKSDKTPAPKTTAPAPAAANPDAGPTDAVTSTTGSATAADNAAITPSSATSNPGAAITDEQSSNMTLTEHGAGTTFDPNKPFEGTQKAPEIAEPSPEAVKALAGFLHSAATHGTGPAMTDENVAPGGTLFSDSSKVKGYTRLGQVLELPVLEGKDASGAKEFHGEPGEIEAFRHPNGATMRVVHHKHGLATKVLRTPGDEGAAA